VSEKEKNE
jgi:hypothetical protein